MTEFIVGLVAVIAGTTAQVRVSLNGYPLWRSIPIGIFVVVFVVTLASMVGLIG